MSKLYLDLFIQSNCGKQMKCTICNCWLPSAAEKFISSHVTGRKHKVELDKKRKREEKLKRSVYIRGFDPLLPDLENELHKYFKSMGVNEIKDVYIDKNDASYGIVEFNDKDTVDTILNRERELFKDKTLVIKRREVPKKEVSNTETENTDDVTSLLPLELIDEMKKKENTDDEMRLLMAFFALTHEDKLLRNLIGELVVNVLEELYPQCKVLQFGSSSNGLGEKGCDIDLTLLADFPDDDEAKICAEIREVIQRFAPGCKNVSIVQSTKTCSIVKFQHTESSLSVDLSLNNHLAINNTELIKAYMNFDERVPIVMFTVRKWATCFGLSGRTKSQITQYSLTLMVIYFLQQVQPPVLPCLQKCHPTDDVMVSQWNCSFCKCVKDGSFGNTSSAGNLLFDFFQFYSSFDYSVNVVAIHVDSVLTREKVYETVNALNLGGAETELKFGSALVVQDPFKLSHNVTHNLAHDGLQLFLESFQRACSVKDVLSLTRLFERQKKNVARNKQKRKRNRSNIYTISLPNCCHGNSESELECHVFVRTILLEDLRMRISDDIDVDLNAVSRRKIVDAEEDKNVPLSTNDSTASIASELKPSVLARREIDTILLPNDVTKSPESKDGLEVILNDKTRGLKRCCSEVVGVATKKAKTETNNPMRFSVTAYADTWTNRRKQRRLIQKIKEGNDVETHKQVDLNEDADSGIIMSDISTTNTSELVKKEIDHMLLEFNVSITMATSDNGICQLKLEPLDESKNVQDFQTFYAYLKKELISVFK